MRGWLLELGGVRALAGLHLGGRLAQRVLDAAEQVTQVAGGGVPLLLALVVGRAGVTVPLGQHRLNALLQAVQLGGEVRHRASYGVRGDAELRKVVANFHAFRSLQSFRAAVICPAVAPADSISDWISWSLTS